MLTTLTIKNFALIDDIALTCSAGLNALTGETGSGKSIIIDALRFCLGERFDSTCIRNAHKPCTVESIFELPAPLAGSNLVSPYLQEQNELIIHRTYTPEGKNRITVNGYALTVGQLKEIGDMLVDFHGPYDHQQLLNPRRHCRMLDQLCNHEPLTTQYQELYARYTKLSSQLAELAAVGAHRDHELEMLSYQIKELTRVPLHAEHYLETTRQQELLQNYETLSEHARSILALFEHDEEGVEKKIQQAFAHMRALNKIDQKTNAFTANLAIMQTQSCSLGTDIKSYLETLVFDEEKAHQVREAYDAYAVIIKKYGPTIADAANTLDAANKRHAFLSSLESSTHDLRAEQDRLACDLENLAQKLSSNRLKCAMKLQKNIEIQLRSLAMEHAHFECVCEKIPLGPEGIDRIEFYISPNAGEPLKPLAHIISSGETARIMLALKTALVAVDPVPVLVFDEIDSHIGGRLGTVTGLKLAELAHARQVLLVTHLPQIAAFARTHYTAVKHVQNNQTCTTIQALTAGQRIEELAHMIDNSSSEISLTHAKAMLASASKAVSRLKKNSHK